MAHPASSHSLGHYAELLVLFLSPTLGCPTQPTSSMTICWSPSHLRFCHIFFMSIDLIYSGTHFKALHRCLRGNSNSTCKQSKTKTHNLWLGQTLYYFAHCSYSTPTFLVYISDCHAFIYLFLFYVLGILPAEVWSYSCEQPCGGWKLNLVPLYEYPVLLTAELPLS